MNEKTDFATKRRELFEYSFVSGNEQALFAYIKENFSPLFDELSTDSLGNVIGIKRCGKPNPYRLMLTAPCDSFGFIVTDLEPNGKLRLHALDSRRNFATLFGKAAVCGKTSGILVSEKEANDCGADDFLLDCGAKNAEEANSLPIKRGDFVSVCEDIVTIGDAECYYGKENTALCAVLLETAQALCDCASNATDVYFVFAAQGRVGARGLRAAASLCPDEVLSLEVYPEKRVVCGDGAVVAYADSACRTDLETTKALLETAKRHGIDCRPSADVFKEIPSSADALCAVGARVGAVGVVCEKANTVCKINETDLHALSELLRAYVCECVEKQQ